MSRGAFRRQKSEVRLSEFQGVAFGDVLNAEDIVCGMDTAGLTESEMRGIRGSGKHYGVEIT